MSEPTTGDVAMQLLGGLIGVLSAKDPATIKLVYDTMVKSRAWVDEDQKPALEVAIGILSGVTG